MIDGSLFCTRPAHLAVFYIATAPNLQSTGTDVAPIRRIILSQRVFALRTP